MANTPVIGSNALVLELLNRTNYANWRPCLETYLLAEDLWEVVTEETESTNFEANDAKYKAWRKNNAKALYAIQKSCGLEMLTLIRELKTAKGAWEALEQEFKVVRGYNANNTDHWLRLNKFRWNVKSGDWDGAIRCLGEIDIHSAVIEEKNDPYPAEPLPLHVAAREGHAHIVKELVHLMTPDDLKRKYTHWTALHIAAWCGHVNVVKVLPVLSMGGVEDTDGDTALHIAVWGGKVEVVKELLGLMKQEDLKIKNKDGRTALHLAVNKGNVPIIREFVRQEQGDSNTGKGKFKPYDELIKYVTYREFHSSEDDLSEDDLCNAIVARNLDSSEDGRTALYIAIQGGDVSIINALLLLLKSREQKLVLRTAEDFISFGSGVNVDVAEGVVMEKAKYMVEQYEKTRVSILDMRDAHNQTALNLALVDSNHRTGNGVTVFAPLLSQESLEVKTSDGTTPLQMSVQKGFEGIVKELVPRMRKEGFEIKDNNGDTALHSAVLRGPNNVEVIKLLVESMRPEGLEVQNKNGSNALHLAIKNKHPHETVIKLMSLMRPEALEQKDGQDSTALGWAIRCLSDDVVLAMVNYMAENNKSVFGISSAPENQIPVVQAFRWNRWKLVRRIYHVTPVSYLYGSQGIELLCYCLNVGKYMDLVWDLFENYPTLGTYANPDNQEFPMFRLARMTYAFKGNHTLTWWKRWIYDFCDLFGQLVKNLPTLCGIFHPIYELKSTHRQMAKFLQRMIEETNEVCFTPDKLDRMKKSIFKHMQQGYFEFAAHLLDGNTKLLDQLSSQEGKGIFHLAIETRQVEIYNLIYVLEKEKRHAVATSIVNQDNTLLHYAANISSSPQSGHILDTSLQMQRELQWFQEVERVVPPEMHEHRNRSDDMTARELFTKNHKKLMEDAESSIKGTATSCTTVGALIVTMIFAAAFTVPDGSDATKGLRKIFIVSDTISLAFSISSVITFLGILTSRYAEDDFLKSLPIKMMIGLITLFFSIASMMIAFSSAIVILLDREAWIVPLSIMCTNAPIILFVWLLFPLIWKTIKFTYGRGIFDGRNNNKDVK